MLKVIEKYDNPYSCYLRTSLLNSGIIGRDAKAYHVSYFKGHRSFGTEATTYTDSRGVISAPYLGSYSDVNFPGPGSGYQYDPFEHPDASGLVEALERKLIARIQEARDTGFNAAVFIAELPKAVEMFASTATRLYRAWGGLRKGDLKAAYTALAMDYRGRVPSKDKVRDRASNYWLEMSYGWTPLLSDVYNAAHKCVTLQFPKYTVQATINASPHRREYLLPNGGVLVVERKLGVRGGVTFSVSNGLIAHAASFGFTNPMLIAWEAFPLTFVADWAIPIGSWLAGFSAFHGLDFVDGYTTRKGTRIDHVSYPGSSQTVYKGVETSPGVFAQVVDYHTVRTASSVRTEQSGFRRDLRESFPSNQLPKLDLDGSWRKLVTSIALLNQMRR